MKFLEKLKLKEVQNINNIDAPEATIIHGKIIQNKVFLRKIYEEEYLYFKKAIGNIKDKKIIELGSGGGFIKNVIPNAITSDIIDLPNIDMKFSALDMPFKNNSVDAFVMINVLHHINDSEAFFREMNRCLKHGGKILMIEPANTLWAKFIYTHFHNEPFEPSGTWFLDKDGGPMSCSNQAIPWILFCRDRKKFESTFPYLKICKVTQHTPFRYLISGGVSMKQLLPSFFSPLVKGMELMMTPLNGFLGMFMTIEVEKLK